ncbi:hypothetical protein ANO11243_092070 [Dothideomycetidae sp. 11243]|nr:hypothetical protein ANO11243_092070 [fungal sp. No.11243]
MHHWVSMTAMLFSKWNLLSSRLYFLYCQRSLSHDPSPRVSPRHGTTIPKVRLTVHIPSVLISSARKEDFLPSIGRIADRCLRAATPVFPAAVPIHDAACEMLRAAAFAASGITIEPTKVRPPVSDAIARLADFVATKGVSGAASAVAVAAIAPFPTAEEPIVLPAAFAVGGVLPYSVTRPFVTHVGVAVLSDAVLLGARLQIRANAVQARVQQVKTIQGDFVVISERTAGIDVELRIGRGPILTDDVFHCGLESILGRTVGRRGDRHHESPDLYQHVSQTRRHGA